MIESPIQGREAGLEGVFFENVPNLMGSGVVIRRGTEACSEEAMVIFYTVALKGESMHGLEFVRAGESMTEKDMHKRKGEVQFLKGFTDGGNKVFFVVICLPFGDAPEPSFVLAL